jgi:aryl-alcohol dehydrogenase-like predicted oxidoreductase
MAGMRDLIDAGKVRHVGVSNFSLRLWQQSEQALGRPVVANQVSFHLLDRRPMETLLPYAQQHGHVIIAYSPLAQGVLGGRYGSGLLPRDFRASNPLFSQPTLDRVAPLLDLLREIAGRHGATPAQIALAWLLHLPQVVVIPGARSVEQLEENAGAADIDLTEAEWRDLEATARAVQPPRPRPGVRRAVTWLLGA